MSVKRTPLNMRQKQLLWDKQAGLCAVASCRTVLVPGRAEDDHHLALVDGGTNELSNRRLICIPCHKAKSAIEHKNNAKAKRIKYGRTRKGPPMAGSRKSRLKKHMDGSVSER
jgi:5-methylcytosine-specific restriction endonuclease McrA